MACVGSWYDASEASLNACTQSEATSAWSALMCPSGFLVVSRIHEGVSLHKLLHGCTVNQQGALNDVGVREAFDGFAGLLAGWDVADALTPGEGKMIDYTIRDAAVRLYERNKAAWSGNCSSLS